MGGLFIAVEPHSLRAWPCPELEREPRAIDFESFDRLLGGFRLGIEPGLGLEFLETGDFRKDPHLGRKRLFTHGQNLELRHFSVVSDHGHHEPQRERCDDHEQTQCGETKSRPLHGWGHCSSAEYR